MPNVIQKGSGPARQIVICLCADWCDTCRAYLEGFRTLAHDQPQVAFVWIDIEDDSEWAGDIDVENFPTLLIGVSGELRFFGTLLPQPAQLARLLHTTQLMATSQSAHPEAGQLLIRICSDLLDVAPADTNRLGS